jgi:feruloyl esterase
VPGRKAVNILFLVTLLGVLSLPASRGDAQSQNTCEKLASASLTGAKVDSAVLISDGKLSITGHELNGLPSFCRVRGTAAPTPQSKIGFELWLPVAGWSGRIELVGNGGYSSQIRLDELAALVRSGDAAVATDTGHEGDGLEFGFNNREAIADWGYRAVHESIVAAKALVTRFYGEPARYSYFTGCSTGGHQGLMEAQRYPEDFNGILAGDPGNNRTNLNFGFLWQFQANHPEGDNDHPILSPDDLKLVNQAVMQKCDLLDGVRDGVITDPRRCDFDPAALRCVGSGAGHCLADIQIAALKRMYGGARRSDTGDGIYPGWPVGSESVVGGGGWQIYWANPQKPNEPQRVDYFRRWAFGDPGWNWWQFDWSKGVDSARQKMGPLVDAVSTDLSSFHGHGGKLLMYQGSADPVVSATDTVAYFEKLKRRNREAASFTRLFMVPGMAHCAGGPGATSFSTGPDADHNIHLALRRWVEQHQAPEQIVAVKPGAQMSRPICAWPKLPAYKGSGDSNDAANFMCR